MTAIFLSTRYGNYYRHSSYNESSSINWVLCFFVIAFIFIAFAIYYNIYTRKQKMLIENEIRRQREQRAAEQYRREQEYKEREKRRIAEEAEIDRLQKTINSAYQRLENARRNDVTASALRKNIEKFQLFIDNFEKENPYRKDLISSYQRKSIEYAQTKLAKMEKYESSLGKSKNHAKKRRTNREAITKSMRYDVLKRDNFRCCICGRSSEDGVKLHVDHIFPVSKGGKTTMDNLRTLCMDCNLGKSDKIEQD